MFLTLNEYSASLETRFEPSYQPVKRYPSFAAALTVVIVFKSTVVAVSSTPLISTVPIVSSFEATATLY